MFQVQQVIQDHLQHNQMLYYLLVNIIYEMVQQELLIYMNIDRVIFLDNFSIKNKKIHLCSFFFLIFYLLNFVNNN